MKLIKKILCLLIFLWRQSNFCLNLLCFSFNILCSKKLHSDFCIWTDIIQANIVLTQNSFKISSIISLILDHWVQILKSWWVWLRKVLLCLTTFATGEGYPCPFIIQIYHKVKSLRRCSDLKSSCICILQSPVLKLIDWSLEIVQGYLLSQTHSD